jgi:hypothetical protein
MTTQKEMRAMFWNDHPQFKTDYRTRKRQNDYRADIRIAWVTFVDNIHRDGTISGKLAARVTL